MFYSELVDPPGCCIHRVAQSEHYSSIAKFRHHKIVAFVKVILYRTWMILWKQVVELVGLLYLMGFNVPEFTVSQFQLEHNTYTGKYRIYDPQYTSKIRSLYIIKVLKHLQ